MSGTISSFAQFETKISVIIVKMCLTFPILTKCAWEPGSRFPRFVEVCQSVPVLGPQ